MKKFPLIVFVFLLLAVSAPAQTEVKSFVDEARSLAIQKKYTEAIAEITKAIQIQPDNADLYITRGEMYYRRGYSNPFVEKDMLTAVSLSPNDAKTLLLAANRLRFIGRLPETLRITDSILALKPSNPMLLNVYQLRFETRYYQKDYAGAFEELARTIETLPTANKTATVEDANLIRDYISFKMKSDMTPALLKELKDDANIFDYYERLFELFERKARELGENPFPILYKYQNPSEAEVLSNTILSHLRQIMFKCVALYQEKGQPADAALLLQRIGRSGRKWYAYADRADYYFLRGMDKEAAEGWNAIIRELTVEIGKTEKPKDKSRLYDRRGDYYLFLKEYQNAIDDFETAVSLDNNIAPQIEKKIATVRQTLRERTNLQN
jgi:tetratricopeptide (TPR) repeat protein